MENWQGIPTTRLTLGGKAIMVPQDNNSTLALSTELLNYKIAFATGKAGTIKYLTVELVVSCYNVDKNLL